MVFIAYLVVVLTVVAIGMIVAGLAKTSEKAQFWNGFMLVIALSGGFFLSVRVIMAGGV